MQTHSARSSKLKTSLGGVFRAFSLALILLAPPALAGGNQVSLGGYDPVSYFDADGPKKGSDEHTVTYEGAVYAFASAENAQKFQSNMDKYAPQFGANCAYGMVFGSKSRIDPKIWKIIDGKIYFHINASTQKRWAKKQGKNIKRASIAWSQIK